MAIGTSAPGAQSADPASDRPCLLCEMESAPSAGKIFEDDLWAASVAPGFEVPGWVFLWSRRHADLITSLNDAEANALGVRARDLVDAVERVTGAPAVYVMTFGENYRHFHAIVTARGHEVPVGRRGGLILQTLSQSRNPDAAKALTGPIRDAYVAVSHGRRPALVE